MQNPSKFNHKLIEEGIYDFWKQNNFFEELCVNKPPFSIIMPPPNVTGHLHLGHAWDGSLQDTIIRYKRLRGFNALWIPGTDHAGIATQTKYEKILASKNIDKSSLTKEEFISQVFDWAKSQAQYIRNQWAKMGFCLSYKNEVFTLDDNVKLLVKQTFVDLYNRNLIYQANKLVNWDVKLKTAISDIETVYKPANSKMYYFKYCLASNSQKYLPIATTRPETMFVDTHVFVNPKDKRYKEFVGQEVINPINNKKLKVLTDSYIDIKFGTGAMKCTPAHDLNDYELAKKHNITEFYSVINPDGLLNEYAESVTKSFKGIDRLIAREAIVEEMNSRKMLIKIEDYNNEVGYSERTGEVVEQLLSKQWFVKMKPIIKELKQIQKSTKYKYQFIPSRFNKTLNRWFDNINDWCISRQLVWGHQLPVWYKKNSSEIYVGVNPPSNVNQYVQDSSVLDTWFSSGLWPIAVTYNRDKNLKPFYPISILVTAYDILFFWVARMLFQCSHTSKQIPLRKILIHGLIRDNQNRKMSKSLGNGIDPMDVIDKFGTDAMRMFMTSTASLGEDLRYDEQKIIFYTNFFNKIWNAKNFVSLYLDKDASKPTKFNLINAWIINSFNKYLKKIQLNMEKYNFVVANKYLVEFAWDIFCNQYIEFVKPLLFDETTKNETVWTISYIFKNILILLHPHAPFLTENIYKNIFGEQQSILLESWPKPIKVFVKKKEIDLFIQIFNFIKDLRIKYSISKSQLIQLNVLSTQKIDLNLVNNFLNKFNINILQVSNARINLKWDMISIGDIAIEFENNFINKDKLLSKFQKQLTDLQKELDRSKTILSNNSFLAKAPKEKIESEQKKYESYKTQYKQIQIEIEKLK